jgi:hypothetical protein
MTRWTSLFLSLLLALAVLAPAMAGSRFLPRIRLPRINAGKALGALTYPVTKSLVNGGKTILKVGGTADSLGVVPNLGPPVVSRVVKRTLWGVGRH